MKESSLLKFCQCILKQMCGTVYMYIFLVICLIVWLCAVSSYFCIFLAGLSRFDVDFSISSLDSKHTQHHSAHQRCVCFSGTHVQVSWIKWSHWLQLPQHSWIWLVLIKPCFWNWFQDSLCYSFVIGQLCVVFI